MTTKSDTDTTEIQVQAPVKSVDDFLATARAERAKRKDVDILQVAERALVILKDEAFKEVLADLHVLHDLIDEEGHQVKLMIANTVGVARGQTQGLSEWVKNETERREQESGNGNEKAKA
jgi:hypothetical protein